MKIQKKLVMLGLGLFILCGAITSVSAYVYESGTRYQTVTHKDIPNYGRTHYDTYYASKKATTGYFATFYKTKGDAMLGNYGELINSNKNPVSALVGLPLNTPNIATEKGCSKGGVYFSAVTSSSIEPSNSCDVTMKFSADNLK